MHHAGPPGKFVLQTARACGTGKRSVPSECLPVSGGVGAVGTEVVVPAVGVLLLRFAAALAFSSQLPSGDVVECC